MGNYILTMVKALRISLALLLPALLLAASGPGFRSRRLFEEHYAKHGREFGNISPQVKIPLQVVVSRQIRLQGSCASSGEYPEAMALLANGKIKVKPLITAVAPLSDGPQWFARLHAGEPNLMKVVLDPGA